MSVKLNNLTHISNAGLIVSRKRYDCFNICDVTSTDIGENISWFENVQKHQNATKRVSC